MGPVRHRRLINWLSIAVALHLAVALVVLAARAGREVDPAADRSAEKAQNGSILSGADIDKRGERTRRNRTAQTSSSTTAPPAPALPPASAPAARGAAEAERPRSRDTAEARSAATDIGLPSLTDRTGDALDARTRRPVSNPRADIVRAGAVFGPRDVTLALLVERPFDPRKDPRWAVDTTYAQWELDTNGDGAPDFEVQYFLVDEDNLGASVTKAGTGGEAACDVRSVVYSSDTYRVTLDPACIGNPTSFSYRATIFYDTNSADESGVVATDAAPNGGWSKGVTSNG